MDAEMLKQILRAQSWQRAKGELYATLYTFYGEVDKHEALAELVEKFVEKVEDDGLCD